ncbi:MAG TPA: type II CAAX endopeptidase family protein [Anaerolineales bacterium]
MNTLASITPAYKQNLLARCPLLSFFTLAIGMSWLIALPALRFGMPFKPFQTAGAYGPLLAAVIVSAALGGDELKSLFHRMTNFRFGLGWYLLAIFGYVVLYLLVAGLSGAPLAGSLTEKWTLIFTLYLPALFTSYLVNPIGEEIGWTGFAVPHLQRRFSPWLSAVILGAVWAVWHLPGFFVPSEMGAFNPVNFIFFLLISIFVRIIWTWITNHTKGSGIVAILLHASSNAVSLALIPNLLPIPAPNQMAISGLILLGFLFFFAVLILVFTRGRLSYKE